MRRIIAVIVSLVALSSVAEAGVRFFRVRDSYGIVHSGSVISYGNFTNVYMNQPIYDYGPVNYPAQTLVVPGMGWGNIQYARPVPMLRQAQPIRPFYGF